MRVRIGILVLSVIVAMLGTVLIAVYVGRLRSEAVGGREIVEIYVAKKHVVANTMVKDLIDRDLIEKTGVPKRYTADGALKSLKGREREVLAAPLDRNEQLTDSVLDKPTSGLKTPLDKLAVAVPMDEVALIDGRIADGDYVSVIVTVEGEGGKVNSRILLHRVLVLATDEGGGKKSSQTGEASLTLALAPAEAEKLMLAKDLGSVWVGLWPPGVKELPKTGGQDSLF